MALWEPQSVDGKYCLNMDED
jgi:hypothetical protein